MKSQFKRGDLVGSVLEPARPGHGDFRGIILDIHFSEAHFSQARMTLMVTLNRNYNKYFQEDFPVNTVMTLTINDLSKWRKIINV